MNRIFRQLMRKATRLTRGGQLMAATAVIQRAIGFGDSAAKAAAAEPAPEMPDRAIAAGARIVSSAAAPAFLDPAIGFDRDPPPNSAPVLPVADAATTVTPMPLRLLAPPVQGIGDRVEFDKGEFISGRHASGTQSRRYKLYIPPGPGDRPRPLVVMLHGCNQDPDDFAAGTGMNRLGGAQNFFVLYPEQSRDANPSRCWNWFSPENQQRDSGEPDLLAGMTLAVITAYKIDPQRVYLAGMSAGGAMAAIVAAAYPEIFAAVGIHSGLTPGAASNVLEALGVMKSGTARGDGRRHSPRPPARQRLGKVATGNVLRTPRAIVFQGDADRTVHPRNGEQVVADLLERIDGSGTLADAAPARVEQGTSAHGRHYTRSSYADADDRVVAEYWLVHGSGHAWSGGLDAGSYTDASGPDASGEMVRFFFDHPNAGAPA